MAQPPAYSRTKDFTEDFGQETDHAALNAELDKASNSINDIRRNLAVLQADDGKLRPFVVTPDSISPELNDVLVEGVVAGAQNMLNQSLAAANTSIASAEKAKASETSATASEKVAVESATSAAGSAEIAKEYAEYANQNGIPVGTVVYFAAVFPPAGYLKADGSAVGRETYPDLFAAIGTTFGEGDGETTFNVPDLRGEFIRGFDSSRGVDSGRTFGSGQGDAIRNLTGQLGDSHSVSLNVKNPTGSINGVAQMTSMSGDTLMYSTYPNPDWRLANIRFDASLQVPTANENRPRNVALLACIKAFDAETNPGLVNVTQLAQEVTNKTSATEAVHATMPSNRYITLSVPVPSAAYNYRPPADGYIGFRGTPTKVGGSVTINTSNWHGVTLAPPVVTVCQTILPVNKGINVMIWINDMTIDFVGFVYANGSL